MAHSKFDEEKMKAAKAAAARHADEFNPPKSAGEFLDRLALSLNEVLILTDSGLDFSLMIDEDRDQLSKWGIQSHSIFEWLAFITEELGELSQAISEFHFRDGEASSITKEAVQVATLALKVAVMVKKQFSEGEDGGE